MANVSVKRVTKEKLQQEIEDNIVMGWELQSKNENVAILTKAGGWGSAGVHILVAIFTIWWTIGIGNLLYALYVHWTSKSELQIKTD